MAPEISPLRKSDTFGPLVSGFATVGISALVIIPFVTEKFTGFDTQMVLPTSFLNATYLE